MTKTDMPASKIDLFGFKFDKCTLDQAIEHVFDMVGGVDRGHYVVTPNLDHAVLLHNRPELQEIYDGAALVVADGFPIIWASRMFGTPLPERVAGSDLVPGVFRAAKQPLRVFLLGALPGVAQKAGENVERQYANIKVVGVHCPPYGFENDPIANDEAVAAVADSAPDVLVVGLGAPKQEFWTFRERHRLRSKVIFCAGATIDFLAGNRKRAPDWFQRHGLEWAYRALGEPKRLLPRYMEDAVTFPRLLAKQWSRHNGQ